LKYAPGVGGIKTEGMSEKPLLSAVGITKLFPGVVALNNVDFDIHIGEIHGVLGQNGAGKSTLLKILYGIHRPDSGKIFFEGAEVKLNSPRDARRRGIVLVHQEITLMPDLTVLENVALLGFMWHKWSSTFDQRYAEQVVESLAGALGVDLDPRARVRSLSVAEKMLIQVIAALSIKAKVILLDEPTSPMTPKETESILEAMKKLKGMGVGIAFVTHRVSEAYSVCDRITILRNGAKVATVRASDTDPQELVRLMLGMDVREVYFVRGSFGSTEKIPQEREPLLEFRGVYTEPRGSLEAPLRNVNMEIYPGEVVAVVGLIGSGKKEVGRTLVGLSKIVRGQLILSGKPVRIKSPHQALKLGIIYLPEDRRSEGLIPSFTVAQNIDISSLGKLSKLGLAIDLRAENEIAINMIKRLNIAAPGPWIRVTKLSGGNQQKVLIARGLASSAKLVVLDEPTIGIDIGSKAEIRRLIYGLSRSEGISFLVLTSDIDEALGLADRVYLIREGEVVGSYVNANLDREGLIKKLVGISS